MRNGHILLVEDSADDEALTLRALKRHRVGNRVVVARDGPEALDYLFATGTFADRSPAEVPVVILLDLNLPKVDGLEVLRRVRADARTRFVPVVVLTSSKEESDLVRSYELGVNSYVQKPVEFERFASAVGEVGLYWSLINEPPPGQR